MPFEVLVDRCVIKPSYQLMLQAYGDYGTQNAPCRDPATTNQCAVRMSVALGRCGFDLEGFPDRTRVHWRRPACALQIPHVLGAEELADYLERALGASQRFVGVSLTTARASVMGQHGIIYFNNCFTRTGQASRTGDHIDLWNGSQYYNQVLGIGAGGNAQAGTDLFARADGIRFFRL